MAERQQEEQKNGDIGMTPLTTALRLFGAESPKEAIQEFREQGGSKNDIEILEQEFAAIREAVLEAIQRTNIPKLRDIPEYLKREGGKERLVEAVEEFFTSCLGTSSFREKMESYKQKKNYIGLWKGELIEERRREEQGVARKISPMLENIERATEEIRRKYTQEIAKRVIRASFSVNSFLREIAIKFLQTESAVQSNEASAMHTIGQLMAIACDREKYNEMCRFDAIRKIILIYYLFLDITRISEESGDDMKEFFLNFWIRNFQPEGVKMGEFTDAKLRFNLEQETGKVSGLAISENGIAEGEQPNAFAYEIPLHLRKIVIFKGTEKERVIEVEIFARKKKESSMARKSFGKDKEKQSLETLNDDKNGLQIVFKSEQDLRDFHDYLNAELLPEGRCREWKENHNQITGFFKLKVDIEGENGELHCYEFQLMTPEGFIHYLCASDISWQEYEIKREQDDKSSMLKVLYPLRYPLPKIDFPELIKRARAANQTKYRKKTRKENGKMQEQKGKRNWKSFKEFNEFVLIQNQNSCPAWAEASPEQFQTSRTLMEKKILDVATQIEPEIKNLRDLKMILRDKRKRQFFIDAVNSSEHFCHFAQITALLKEIAEESCWLNGCGGMLAVETERIRNANADNTTLLRQQSYWGKIAEAIDKDQGHVDQERKKLFLEASRMTNNFFRWISKELFGTEMSLQDTLIEFIHDPGTLLAIGYDDDNFAETTRFDALRKFWLMTKVVFEINNRRKKQSSAMAQFVDFWNDNFHPKEEKIGHKGETHLLFYNLDPTSLKCTEYEVIDIADQEKIKQAESKFAYSKALYCRSTVLGTRDEKRQSFSEISLRELTAEEEIAILIRDNTINFAEALEERRQQIQTIFLTPQDIKEFHLKIKRLRGVNAVSTLERDVKGITGFYLFNFHINGTKYEVRAFTPEGIINYECMKGKSKEEWDLERLAKSNIPDLLFPAPYYKERIGLEDEIAQRIEQIQTENAERNRLQKNPSQVSA